jgi:hypothetical protein
MIMIEKIRMDIFDVEILQNQFF